MVGVGSPWHLRGRCVSGASRGLCLGVPDPVEVLVPSWRGRTVAMYLPSCVSGGVMGAMSRHVCVNLIHIDDVVVSVSSRFSGSRAM